MGNASIGGLVSGMDTASIISQLMQLEARPQSNLRGRVSGEQRAVNALQTLNSKFAAIASKAAALATTGGWTLTKATSSNDTVTARTTSAANPGAVTFQALSVARAYSAGFATTAPSASPVIAPNTTFQLQYDDGRPALTTLKTGDGSLSAVAKALNASGTGVTASLVSVDGTNYRLQVTSSTTGATSGFRLTAADGTTPLLGAAVTSSAGADARVRVKGEVTDIVSRTNTFVGVMPGVDVTLSAATPLSTDLTVTVARDVQALADSVKSMVDAANLALEDIKSLTSYDPATKKAGLLVGDSLLRRLRDDLVGSVTRGIDGQSLATVGIQVDKTGKIVFDSTKFTDAYKADPAVVFSKFAGVGTWSDPATDVTLHAATWRTQPGAHAVVADATGGTIGGVAGTLSGNILSGARGTPAEGLSLSYTGSVNGTFAYRQGFAAKLEALAQRASDANDGMLSLTVKTRQSQIKGWEDDIADWDTRLASRREALQRQYTALESALGKLQSQGSWLAGQIGSLPKMSQ